MDGEMPNPPNVAEPEQTQSPLKTLTLLKIGVFEILFVSIALILFFGIMNYFNLLPISTLWPNQFGWLPHRTVSTKNNINTTIIPTIAPTISLSDSAKQTLNAFLPTILNQVIVPNSDIKLGSYVKTGRETPFYRSSIIS